MSAAALWLQPALLAALALRVAAGAADAPWLVLGALVAPLVALLAPVRRRPAPGPVAGAAAALAVTGLLAANFLLAADAAGLLGGARWQGVVVAAVLALLPLAAPALRPGPLVLALAAAALLAPLGPLAVARPPWTAWSLGGLRPALTFGAASAWVQDGERFARVTRLTFTEGQRVTVLTPGVYRVVERDAVPPTVREWRLQADETLTLRPGDELTVAAGARLRFEAGRRVPGMPASGIAWADAPARGPWMLPAALGALVTLVGGAVALVPAATGRGRAVAAGPVLLLAGLTAATGWGVYAAATAPDLVLGGSLTAPLLRVPALALGRAAGAPLAALAAAGLALLLACAAVALRQRLAAAARPEPAVWAAVVGVAALLTAVPLDPWRLLTLALGIAAAAWAPAVLATTRGAALGGALAGGLAFAGLAALPVLAPPTAATLGALVRYPALLALPLGWLVARGLDGMTGDGGPGPQA